MAAGRRGARRDISLINAGVQGTPELKGSRRLNRIQVTASRPTGNEAMPTATARRPGPPLPVSARASRRRPRQHQSQRRRGNGWATTPCPGSGSSAGPRAGERKNRSLAER